MNGTWNVEGEQYILDLDTIMLINSCIDRLVMYPSYPHIAINNTYGIESVNETIYEGMIDALYREGGCNDQIYLCRNLSLIYDPENIGINKTVNQICADAENFCYSDVRGPYLEVSGRNYYDMVSINEYQSQCMGRMHAVLFILSPRRMEMEANSRTGYSRSRSLSARLLSRLLEPSMGTAGSRRASQLVTIIVGLEQSFQKRRRLRTAGLARGP